MKINDGSHHYLKEKIKRESLSAHPIDLFQNWFDEAEATEEIEVNAMSLATATKDGRPSCRTVLLKSFDKAGLVFFTNYDSRKGQELIENPQATVLFFWRKLMRQVTCEGIVEKTTLTESNSYFVKRPRGSQLGAWASKQGSVIPSREYLEERFHQFDEKFKDSEIMAPPYWGGFRLVPRRFEFWQGMQNRMHDRFQYLLMEDGTWKIDRLSP